MSDALSEARSITQGRPSAHAWTLLCDLLDAHPDEVQARVLVPYCDGALRRWPDAMRVAPRIWCDRCLDGDAPPSLALARAATLDVTGLTPEQTRHALEDELLARLGVLELRDERPLALRTVRALTRSSLVESLTRVDVRVAVETDRRSLSALLNSPRLSPELAPLHLELYDSPDLDVLLDAPGARVLGGLRFRTNPRESTFEALCTSRALYNLRALDLSFIHLDPSRARRLMDAEHLEHVRSLDVSLIGPSSLTHWGADTTSPLMDSPLVEGLEHLEVNHLDVESAEIVGRCHGLSELRSLHVMTARQHEDGVASALLPPTTQWTLESLHVNTAELAGTLAHVDTSRLRSLSLINCGTNSDDLEAIAQMGSLEELTLRRSHGVHSLMRIRDALPDSLDTLTLDGCRANAADDLDELGSRLAEIAPTSLCLQHVFSHLTHSARPKACELLALGRLERLHTLDLGGNELTDEDLDALSLHACARLHTLTLTKNALGDPRALFEEPPPNLRVLGLASNPLDMEALGDLLASPALDGLRALYLNSLNTHDEELAKALARANLPSLRTLSIRWSSFGPASAKALAASGLLANLRALDVARASNQRALARALSDIPEASNLTRLVLGVSAPVDIATLDVVRTSSALRPRLVSAMSASLDHDALDP